MAASSTSAPSIAAPSLSASSSTSVEPRPDPFSEMPAPSLVKENIPPPLPSAPSASAGPAPSIEHEQVIAPDPHTLAHGKYEAKPLIIWLCVGLAAIVLAVHVTLRIRRHLRDKRALESRLRTVAPTRTTKA